MTVTPLTSMLPLQVNVRWNRLSMFSIAAESVTSLNIEPGVKLELMQRLIYTPSGRVEGGLEGSMDGEETMQSSSPVL